MLESNVLVRNHALRNAIGEFERARPDLFPASRDADGASKVVILGDSGVGKTCLLTRIQSRSFPEHTSATIGCAFCPHTVLLPSGKAVELHLWDTAGQEKYRSFTRQYFRGSAAAVVAFDLTSSASFEGAKHWVEELKHELPEVDLVVALAGCKVDLCPERRQVTANESRTLAAEHSMTFFEVSALDGTNVDPLFRAVAARIDHARNHRLSARGLQLGLGDGLSGNRHRCAC